MLKEMVNVDESFQYSVNIQYDLNNINKVNSYIPTEQSYSILKYYLESIAYKNKDRANVLIGPYGKGKSHLILVLLALIYGNEKKNFTKLNYKLENIDSSYDALINKVSESCILPIIVNSNYTDLNQSFLLALNNALEREGLQDIRPNTYFEVINNKINDWKENFIGTYKEFIMYIEKEYKDINEFIDKIEEYDNDAFELFIDIYPKVTSGATFNPLIQVDIVKLYEEITNKLCEVSRFKGIFIIFDEFSKFIEAGISENVIRDLKIIQDIAELASRSEEKQIHLTCITHKTINDYIYKLPEDKINAWRAVEGRFKEIYFTSTSNENYELVANTIIKKNSFKEKFKSYENIVNTILDEAYLHGLFKDVDRNIIGKGCFPINPIATFALMRVSEKVAQNERTLFTFLSKDEDGSLARFIEYSNEIDLLNIDHVYDYFNILFKKEVFDEYIYRIWIKSNSALKKTNNSVDRKIIKALAVIYIINELKTLTPTDIIIRSSLNLPSEVYESSIKRLIEDRILMKNRSNSFYRFLTTSDVNIKKQIESVRDSLESKFNLKQTLENIVNLGYIVPKKYNNDYKMIRFYKRMFMTAKEFTNIRDFDRFINEFEADGILLNLVYFNSGEVIEVIDHFNTTISSEFSKNRIIICVPDKPFNTEMIDNLKTYMALEKLKNNKEFINLDEYVFNEIKIYEEDIIEAVRQYIAKTHSTTSNCKYLLYKKELFSLKRDIELNRLVSNMCEFAYRRTPIINNELINKEKITKQIQNARDKIIEAIIENKELHGNGPEATIYRATIQNKGLKSNNLSDDENLNNVLNLIEDFIRNAIGAKLSFEDIYKRLIGDSIGLRKGIIPIYLAYVINRYKEYTVIYMGRKEIPLTVDLFNKINEFPVLYEIMLEPESDSKIKYIEGLMKMFKSYNLTEQIGYSVYGSIAKWMQTYVRSLPKYTRGFINYVEIDSLLENQSNVKTRELKLEYQMLRSELLKYEVNARELLFDWIPQRLFPQHTFAQILNEIEEFKKQLDFQLDNVKKYLIGKVKILFDNSYKGELGSALKNWYETLCNETTQHKHSATVESLLLYLKKLDTHDERQIISRLGKLVTGLSIEDWNDKTILDFLDDVNAIKNYLDGFNTKKAETAISQTESIKPTNEFTDIGNMAYREVMDIFEDYGDSIDIEEKISILTNLLLEIKKERY